MTPNFSVLVAESHHTPYAAMICDEMAASALARGTGIARRSPEYIEQKMKEGKAVIAFSTEGEWAGFCYIESWSHGEYVANSGLIVVPAFRKSGIAKEIKSKIFELSRKLYPESKIFGLTTGLAVMKINSELGYKPVTYSELTQDEAFWQGCKSCVNFPILESKERKNCLCTAMLYDAATQTDAQLTAQKFNEKTKSFERLLKLKRSALLKYFPSIVNRIKINLAMTNNKVVLAFSGGLDTTYCAIYLKENLGLQVHAILVQTGGFSPEELEHVEARAKQLGVASFTIADVTNDYYQKCVKYLVFGNVLKNNSYPLSVSAERMMQAIAVAEHVQKTGAAYVAHGSTGAGNDQVRFDMVFQSIIPDVKILTPVRDQSLSREAEIKFLKEHGVEMDFAKAKYSINKGLWGTSVGGKETLTSNQYLPEEAWPTAVSATEPKDIVLHFEHGELKGIDGKMETNSVIAIQRLQAIAQAYGIGRDIHVGDTIIGIKGRVGFEAAAPLIIIKAHHQLEKHTLTKWQLYWKDQLSNWYGNWLHEGMMLDPTMRNIEAFLEDTQQTVSGTVAITLYPYRFVINGIESENDLMNNKFGAYGEENKSWSGEDVRGFAKIFGNQVSIFHSVNKKDAAN